MHSYFYLIILAQQRRYFQLLNLQHFRKFMQNILNVLLELESGFRFTKQSTQEMQLLKIGIIIIVTVINIIPSQY